MTQSSETLKNKTIKLENSTYLMQLRRDQSQFDKLEDMPFEDGFKAKMVRELDKKEKEKK